MIRDWDLWPGRIAYESDAGRIERLNRSFLALAEAFRRIAITAERATAVLRIALSTASQPPADEPHRT
jgi:hypothetical protein